MVNPDEEAIVRCETTAGSFSMKFYRTWAPNGYDRAVELFERKFYDQSYFFRVVPKFLVQFGISYIEDKQVQKLSKTPIQDDPSKGIPFKKGTISFAGSGPNSRTSHLFIAYGSIKSLGTQLWETALGEVIEGMENVENLYSYGDMPPWGNGPPQGKVYQQGYMEENFPKSDKFLHCKVERLSDDIVTGKLGNGGAVLNKEDHRTDEEEFAKLRAEQQQKQNDASSSSSSQQQQLRQRDLRPMDKAADLLAKRQQQQQLAMSAASQEEEKWLAIGGILVLVVMIVMFMLFGRNKKIVSKSN